MLKNHFYKLAGILLLCYLPSASEAVTDKYRVMWRKDPSTTMVIGWNQVSGENPVLLLDVLDHGQNAPEYAVVRKAGQIIEAKGMKNHFVRLEGLKPNTTYYFVIEDSEGISKRLFFTTAPADSEHRLSLIAGGDSRNHRQARQESNKLVAKLRPHCVLFGGDMTKDDTAEQWQEWLDDWQLTIAEDGRMTPIIVARGNHESENQTLIDLFDVKSKDLYYALSLGGDLLRIYTLNSLVASGGNQKIWVQRDLQASTRAIWKIAQYHFPMRPHTKNKPEHNHQMLNWATLFFKFGVNLAIESDAHVVKSTWPVRPGRGPRSDEGFVRDDEKGTVYVGEGCWGAPLRQPNDDKSWTRASGSFNQFKWIFVDREKMEVRTIRTNDSKWAEAVDPDNIFETPVGLVLWNPPSGAVITIPRHQDILEEPPASFPPQEEDLLAAREAMEVLDFSATREGPRVIIKWSTRGEPAGLLYELQRSLDAGETYTTISTLASKEKPENNYRVVDTGFAIQKPGKYINYRLRRTFSDGKCVVLDLRDIHKRDGDWQRFPLIEPDPVSHDILIKYSLKKPANVAILLLNPKMQAAARMGFENQNPGAYSKTFDLKDVPNGRYLLVIKANRQVIRRFRVVKRP